jgi:malate dehydrogenase (oxaloacetate-decarboxylating)(NADP+)
MTSPQQSPSQDDLKQQQREALRKAALEYHEFPTPGKISVTPTKPLSTSATWRWPIRRAWRRRARKSWPIRPIRSATPRGNLVAVITNGTAVLGLGNIGAAASKPVMEGKAGLFKKFAGIDVFDIEVDENPGSWSTSSPRSSRRSAASTSKTSRRRSASTSSASCASG